MTGEPNPKWLETVEPPIRWSREPPKQEGWYWYRGADGVEEIVEVEMLKTRRGKQLHMSFAGLEVGALIEELPASDEWAGPLEPPAGEGET